MKWFAIAGAVLIAGAVAWHCRSAEPVSCELPPRDCEGGEARCGELVQFLPSSSDAYEDRALDGETSTAESTSYLRRDLMMLIKYATAKVACESADWPGNHGPLGLGDMSDRAGQTPGTLHGMPRHPKHTHEDGLDIDVAYYQRGTDDNHMRPICEHGIGVDELHCTRPPRALDERRTALLIGALFESPRVRIVGLDDKAVPAIRKQLDRLCRSGTIPSSACTRVKLGFETGPNGRQWYYGHHNHLHVSLLQPHADQ